MSIETVNKAGLRTYPASQATPAANEAANPFSPTICVALLVAAIGLVIALG